MNDFKLLTENYRENLLKRLEEYNFSSNKLTPQMLLSANDIKDIKNWLTSRYGINGENAINNLSAFKDGDLPVAIQTSIIEEAQNKNKYAINYLFYRCFFQIKQAFTSYLGTNAYYRSKKLANATDGGVQDWLTVCFNTLCGGYDSTSYDFEKSAIMKFDLSKGSTIDSFASFYSNYLRNAINYEHKIQNRNGFTGWGIDKDTSNIHVSSIDKTINSSDNEKTFGDMLSDENENIENNYLASEDEYLFIKNWQNLCMDPDFYQSPKDVKADVSPADVIKYVLNDAIRLTNERATTGKIESTSKKLDMFSELGVTSYEFSKVMKKFGNLIEDYNITQEELTKNIKTIGPSIIVKYIVDK